MQIQAVDTIRVEAVAMQGFFVLSSLRIPDANGLIHGHGHNTVALMCERA
jgi:hypothetical protein